MIVVATKEEYSLGKECVVSDLMHQHYYALNQDDTGYQNCILEGRLMGHDQK